MKTGYVIPLLMIAPLLLLILTIPASGQENTVHGTEFYLTSSDQLSLTPSSGTISTPDNRIIGGGGSDLLGEWESMPALNPIRIGGSALVSVRAGGIGTGISFSAAIRVGEEEIGSGRSGSSNLLSSSAGFEIRIEADETILEQGETISLEITFHAGMSRGVEIELGQVTSLRIGTGDIPLIVETHDHEGTIHISAGFPTPWGEGSIMSATASLVSDEETSEVPFTSMEESEGNMTIEWMIEEPPGGEMTITVNVIDLSGNTYSAEAEMDAHAHDHSHGGIMVSTGSITLLVVVILGVVGIGYIGGITPLSSFFDERKMRYLLAFAAGVFLATALFHALPESLEMSGLYALLFVGLGFLTLYAIEHWIIDLIDRKFRKKGHHHEHKGVALHLHNHHSTDHEILTDQDIDPADQVCSHHMENTSEAAFFGVGLHNLIEGIVITTLFMNPQTQAVGLIVILATILHKAPCTFSIASLLKMAGNSPGTIKKKVLIVLAMTPVGAVLSLLLFMNLDEMFIGLALAFSAGTFLEIGLLDLAPESLKPKNGRMWAVIAMVAGFVLLWLFSLVHVH